MSAFGRLGRVFACLVIFAFLGIFACVVEGWMVENGVILDEFITGTITLTDLMAITMVGFMLAGLFTSVIIAVRGD